MLRACYKQAAGAGHAWSSQAALACCAVRASRPGSSRSACTAGGALLASPGEQRARCVHACRPSPGDTCGWGASGAAAHPRLLRLGRGEVQAVREEAPLVGRRQPRHQQRHLRQPALVDTFKALSTSGGGRRAPYDAQAAYGLVHCETAPADGASLSREPREPQRLHTQCAAHAKKSSSEDETTFIEAMRSATSQATRSVYAAAVGFERKRVTVGYTAIDSPAPAVYKRNIAC